MHKAKLRDAFQELPLDLFKDGYEVIDWGCGQALGTVNLFDYLHENGIKNKVNKVTLIEPAKITLERAVAHAEAYLDDSDKVHAINSYFEVIYADSIRSNSGLPVIHIFSNILDVAEIDLKHLANIVDENVNSENYIACVGPLNPMNQRIDAFYNYFDVPLLYEKDNPNFKGGNWTYKCRLYKLSPDREGHLIPIEYYPSVHFHAAIELDSYRERRKLLDKEKQKYTGFLSKFDVSAPFDIGASVYEDVHPLFAVLNNIVTRGLPTKASDFIEDIFSKSFGTSVREINLGEISYKSNNQLDLERLIQQVEGLVSKEINLTEVNLENLQELLSPIAIARFQKMLIEAIITGNLDLKKERWSILVEEKDVPFSAIAIKDFRNLFHNLSQLTRDYSDIILPEIDLEVISNNTFYESPLHLDAKVSNGAEDHHLNKVYDFVLDFSILELSQINQNALSKYKCFNNCYFKLRSVRESSRDRTVYTSSIIKYKDLVEKTDQGYIDIEENKAYLNYFLNYLFRKESFRPGQLPILDRALKKLPVIGLLPTGGGKSLTYQIAAMLQPGITMVIDPLISLMKDQYDGLINNGIDCCTYINSTVSSSEKKKRERRMESSQLLFVFVSPERLSILKFRERLKHMHDYNVYFSYGVIDEVHCVSEWGHDFRFSYLHLGRNLYNYVRAKDDEISLFGLTATASFDVLADVERELSGNGSFLLDSETIVRYENTNRLELQYKVEKVRVKFEEDIYFDRNRSLDASLPRAVNVSNKWSVYDSKSDFLRNYLQEIPDHLNLLQTEKNTSYIKERFFERQNSKDNRENDLSIKLTPNMFQRNGEYKDAGIIFCPHVKSTGVSVQKNTRNLKSSIEDVGSFSGSDESGNSMKNLELFRENKLPLMVATKAFGMGIDKPNVRYTVNMNYSSSLESFVQEAGRAGRDRKMALSVILLADYKLKTLKRDYKDNTYPVQLIKNKWFENDHLDRILEFYNLNIPEEFIEEATPSKDLVKLYCSKDNKMFAFNQCNSSCSAYQHCQLRKSPQESKGWHTEESLAQLLAENGLSLNRKHLQYLSADYETVMYFFNTNFKGDIIEKTFMHNLLSRSEVEVERSNEHGAYREEREGFLSRLIEVEEYEEVIVYVPYTEEDSADISKAIYRMCCIGLVEDFTQDYRESEFRIKAIRKPDYGYFEGLNDFLLRYYTRERARQELDKALDYEIKESDNPLVDEIRRCLAYLTEFVYDKISEKRKRAIDDMRNFCIEGVNENNNWIERNEDLKDFIFYYFNSKYAKTDYVAENGEPYSLTEDTDYGKVSNADILRKYLRVVDDEIVGVGTPIDNVKHLQGAVRLIKRSLTDNNPTLSLLNAFTLFYLGFRNNPNLENEAKQNYYEGILEMGERMDFSKSFWNTFAHYNKVLEEYLELNYLEELKTEVNLIIHSEKLKTITNQYLNSNE
ncbi:recombinase RecQ [Christiangramia fulva]|uniref:DNA 3'-5' helicase n=2 Tax=Christiangramia fulva TaxID=2126553 RepID=A0A2R3Z3C7_9FLAO|nr:recombinase RecQ [Christiangramia fulva]